MFVLDDLVRSGAGKGKHITLVMFANIVPLSAFPGNQSQRGLGYFEKYHSIWNIDSIKETL